MRHHSMYAAVSVREILASLLLNVYEKTNLQMQLDALMEQMQGDHFHDSINPSNFLVT